MNRFFVSDKESDMLIALASKELGLKIGETINIAIKNEFLPVGEPFRMEAAFILQRKVKDSLDAWEIKQSMSRGIKATGMHPVCEAERLQGFFARYHLHDDAKNSVITANDALWKSAVEICYALGREISTGDTGKIDGARLVDDIFAAWDVLWNKKAVYDVLAALAFRCEPSTPFDWFEGIAFLKGLERDAMGCRGTPCVRRKRNETYYMPLT